MAPFHMRFYRSVRQRGVAGTVDRALDRFFDEPRFPRRIHWSLSSWYHRRDCANDIQAYRAPPDPFKLEWVDPKSITRHTRRRYPPWSDRLDLFGAVQGGNWDRREWPPVDPNYDGPPPELFIADQFEESVLYRSLEAHFNQDLPWEETELFRKTVALLEDGDRRHVWHGCQSVADLHDRFQFLEELYDEIRTEGFESQRSLVASDPEKGFRDWLLDEITVDVGRNGELLLVCGKHRLSIAKLLDIDRVPVFFLVRHPEWMTIREHVAETGDSPLDLHAHPDLRDIDPVAE